MARDTFVERTNMQYLMDYSLLLSYQAQHPFRRSSFVQIMLPSTRQREHKQTKKAPFQNPSLASCLTFGNKISVERFTIPSMHITSILTSVPESEYKKKHAKPKK
jgi:hypothetical protein